MKYSMDLNRRRLLALAGTTVTASTAGCSGGDGSNGNDADGGSNPDESGSQTDGADNNGDGQGTDSPEDGSDAEGSEPSGRQNIEEGPEEFENYTRTSYLVEVFDECGETLEYENWIGPNAGEIGIALGVVGRNGCDVVSRESEAYDEETQTLTLELDISPLEGATCEDDCMVQNDVIVGYQFPVDVMEDLSIEVFASEDGGEPELRAEYPFENERSV